MSAHCRAGFSVAFIGSVHDVKFSYWLQLLECYIKMYNQNGCDCICLSSYTPYYALNLQKKEVAVAIFAKLKLCRHRRPATHTSCSEKLIESGQLIKGLMDWTGRRGRRISRAAQLSSLVADVRRQLSFCAVQQQDRLLLDRLSLLGDGANEAARRRDWAVQLEGALARRRQAQEVSRR